MVSLGRVSDVERADVLNLEVKFLSHLILGTAKDSHDSFCSALKYQNLFFFLIVCMGSTVDYLKHLLAVYLIVNIRIHFLKCSFVKFFKFSKINS